VIRENTGSAVSTVADIEAIIAKEAPRSPILSIVVVDPRDDLTSIEPSLKVTGEGLRIPSTVWMVRVLETDRISTYLIVDGSDAIYEMNPDNHPVQVGGTLPGAKPTASPRGYTLDCGPLGTDSCEAKAADVNAATPTRRKPS
jgi:hypothetical protein